jgi:NADH:ubiquinone oxidoreductase subunit 5 (subunit L)/multisubunit Na+/H+ antiporter MnhA subunit
MDPLSMVMASLAVFMAASVSLYARGYAGPEEPR